MILIDKSPLEDYLFQLISAEIDRKETTGITPCEAHLEELLARAYEDCKSVLRDMVRKRTLTCHQDGSDIYLYFTQPNITANIKLSSKL